MKPMKKYQEQAVNQLILASKMYFQTENNETIVLQSPTGSGKTFMLTNYISEIVKETEHELCFLWVSIGSGNLHIQSYKSVKKNISSLLECSLLEEEFLGKRNKINKNEVVFLNWEKIRKKDETTGQYINILMKDKDDMNFIEVLENTRNSNTKIVLIIDESHKSAKTARAQELRDNIIKPFLTIEMSATPVLSSDMQMKIQVDPIKVIEEGMIKKEIIINKDISAISNDELYSQNLILESAYEKRLYLKSLYEKCNSNVNPLILIQLPNSDAGEVKKKAVLEFFEKKGIKSESGKIAIWLSEDKVNIEGDSLTKNDSEIEFLLFKQAVDTGWDCPRAQILVKFRESSSITFEIQTVGRILRMPEAKHYDCDDLNSAYVYTNIKSIEIKKEIYNPNIIKSICSRRGNNYENIKLNSYYKNRVDYGDITSEYSMFFERSFCRFFEIEYKDLTIPNYKESVEKMKKKGIKDDYDQMDSILNDVEVDTNNFDNGMIIKEDSTLYMSLSPEDLDIKYNKLLSKNVGSFSQSRSVSKLKTAILAVFRKYLNIKPSDGGIVKIQNVVVRNEEIFDKILSKALDEYKDFHEKDIQSKNSGRYNSEWEIPESKNYNPETNSEVKSELSLYQPLYMPCDSNRKVDDLELQFIRYLELHKDRINWFWKNGDEHMESNFGIRKENGLTFQPDFIISFSDGSI
ncbi:MAG: DEAD/DEAH box helicase family protein, partial [Clostridia bacterium]|nr:DEAD/DEAH box helicase family protein [Clostridia bacterium]